MSVIDFLEQTRILDIKLMDAEDFSTLVIRFAFNVFVTFLIARLLYYPIHRDKDYVFTFFTFNTLVFFVCYLLSGVKLEIGVAFGLFALFSILRYRTITLPVKEMTYLFAVIAIGVVNAISTRKVSYAELFFTNFSIVGLIYVLDRIWLTARGATQYIIYEKIQNIKPENKDALIEDLKDRTGLNVTHAEISRINFMNDTARIKVFYNPDKEGLISRTDSGEYRE